MTENGRALCIELLDCLEKADWPCRYKIVFQQWVDRAYSYLSQPDSEAADARRYRWIKSKKTLELATEGVLWIRENGERYCPSHRLAVNGTGFNGVEHLDDLIDQAMEMYP